MTWCTCGQPPQPHLHYPDWLQLVGDRLVFMMLEHWWPASREARRRRAA